LVTDETLFFSKEQAINCLIIASSYIASRDYFGGNAQVVTPYYGACLNPAIALGITLTAVFGHPASTWKYIWLYPVMPFLGAILAVLFYEFVYKKT